MSVIFFCVLSTWQLFLSHVEIPNLGRMYACRTTHPTMIKTKTQILIPPPFFWVSLCSNAQLLPDPINTAHGCTYQAHEKPPCDAHDVEAEPLPRPSPEPEERDENVDNSFSLSSLPQEGQGPLSSPVLRKHRDSKMFPHFLHLNS